MNTLIDAIDDTDINKAETWKKKKNLLKKAPQGTLGWDTHLFWVCYKKVTIYLIKLIAFYSVQPFDLGELVQ